MKSTGLNVVLIIFNRPETTRRVFGAIRRRQPARLFVIADGPREGRESEERLVAETRAATERVDWDCTAHRYYASDNQGLKQRISTGLSEVFKVVEEAVILEDDCIPDPTFFTYCSELLTRYRDDPSVMAVSGNNFQYGRRRTPHSYYFSQFPHCWGWATWSRAWELYDGEMWDWPRARVTRLIDRIFQEKTARRYWRNIFDACYCGEADSWAYPWTFACWLHGGLTAIPEVNLVHNIGVGHTAATHTRLAPSHLSRLAPRSLRLPLRHPLIVAPHKEADRYTQSNHFERGVIAATGRIVRRRERRLKTLQQASARFRTKNVSPPVDKTTLKSLIAGLDVPEEGRAQLRGILDRMPEKVCVQDVWRSMDATWDQLGCDQTRPESPEVDHFYDHPVWLLNGAFVELDALSKGHRQAIVEWIGERLCTGRLKDHSIRVLDYGGGFGTLARIIAESVPNAHVDLFEPFAHRAVWDAASDFPNLDVVAELKGPYDFVVAQDVFEHLPQPLASLREISALLRPGGFLIAVNNFTSCIKAHLPQTFHLRWTFWLFARLMGFAPFRKQPFLQAQVYRRGAAQPASPSLVSLAEKGSRAVSPGLNSLWMMASRGRQRLQKEPQGD